MAIISVNEKQEDTQASIAFTGRDAERRFLVETDDARDAKALALDSGSIPNLGDFYQYTTTAGENTVDETRIAHSIDAQAIDGKPTWIEIIVRYQSVAAGSPNQESPELDVPTYSISFFDTEEPIYLDINDDPIQNSAGQSFDPPLTEIFVDQVITITINKANFSLHGMAGILRATNNKLNSDNWLSNPPRTAWMRTSASNDIRNGVQFWRVVYTILIRPEGWDRKVIDEGFQSLQTFDLGDTFVLAEVVDPAGRPVNAPIRLDGSGKPLAQGLPAVILTFQTKDVVNFGNVFSGYNFSSVTP